MKRECCIFVPRGHTPASLLGLYILRSLAIKSLHVVLLNLHRTWIVIRTGKGRAQSDHPHCDLLPSLCLIASHFRLLKTFYRELSHTSRPLHQWVLPLFYVMYVVTTPLPPVPIYQMKRWQKIRDPECVEIWECFVCND